MTTLASLFSEAAASRASTVFLSGGASETWSSTRFWDRALRYGAAAEAATAVVLTNDVDSAALALGVLATGKELVSLPLPARRQDLDDYLLSLSRLASSAGAVGPVRTSDAWASLTDGPHALAPLSSLDPDRHRRAEFADGGALVQHSSGTTGPPKPISVSSSQLAGQASALLDALDVRADDVLYSWLPFSHDMGFVGCLVSAFVATSKRWGAAGPGVFAAPEALLASPRSWLHQCSDLGATITAGPSFAYARSATAWGSRPMRPLRLRACLVGGEMIDPEDLRLFTRQTGVAPEVMCPAWGMAEATLAVTIAGPSEAWRSERVTIAGLEANEIERPTGGEPSVELVSCGDPIPGAEVRTDGAVVAGLQVRASGIARAPGGAPLDGMTPDGWWPTGDIGFRSDAGWVVVGRDDDVLVLGGANHHAATLEATIADALGGAVPQRSVAVLRDGDGFSIALEGFRPTDRSAGVELVEICRKVWAKAPKRIVVLHPTALPRSPSGKLRRVAAEHQLAAGRFTDRLA